jgi:hypothetical protein
MGALQKFRGLQSKPVVPPLIDFLGRFREGVSWQMAVSEGGQKGDKELRCRSPPPQAAQKGVSKLITGIVFYRRPLKGAAG